VSDMKRQTESYRNKAKFPILCERYGYTNRISMYKDFMDVVGDGGAVPPSSTLVTAKLSFRSYASGMNTQTGLWG
jgi:hypothetical protein